MTPDELALIGVPANSSGTVDGVARGPAVLRQRGLAAALARHPGFTDAGDLVLPAPVPVRGPSGLLAEYALLAMIGHVAEAVGAARGRGRFPLLLGGDCPVILGALAALQAATATMRVTDADVEDYHTLKNALLDGPSDPASVSFVIRWHGVKARVEVRDFELGFAGRFIEDSATVEWTARVPSTGFSFRSDPATISKTTFAEIGSERNGVFFT